MKTASFGIAALMTVFLTAVIVMGLVNDAQLRKDMQSDLSYTVDSVMTNAMKTKDYNISSSEELVYDVLASLIEQSSERFTNYKANIYSADIENGVLSVEIVGTYKKINGKNEDLICRKTVVLDNNGTANKIKTIRYLTDGFVYRNYEVREGENFVVPKNPSIEGKTFRKWKVKMGAVEGLYTGDELQKLVVDANYDITAVFS